MERKTCTFRWYNSQNNSQNFRLQKSPVSGHLSASKSVHWHVFGLLFWLFLYLFYFFANRELRDTCIRGGPNFPYIYKVWWLREASQIGQTQFSYRSLCEKACHQLILGYLLKTMLLKINLGNVLFQSICHPFSHDNSWKLPGDSRKRYILNAILLWEVFKELPKMDPAFIE